MLDLFYLNTFRLTTYTNYAKSMRQTYASYLSPRIRFLIFRDVNSFCPTHIAVLLVAVNTEPYITPKNSEKRTTIFQCKRTVDRSEEKCHSLYQWKHFLKHFIHKHSLDICIGNLNFTILC